MEWLSSRAVPVAVISLEPFLGTQQALALLYSLFERLKSAVTGFALWEIVEILRLAKYLQKTKNSKKFTDSN
jgi:hypothetical protein